MTLLSIIKKDKYKKNQIKILILGLDNSGKTSILNNMLGKDQKGVIPTIGFNIINHKTADKNLNFWDIGGQLNLRNFWFNYFNDKFNEVLWVIDLSNLMNRYVENLDEFEKIKKYLINLKLVVVLNKLDLFEGDVEEVKSRIMNDLNLEELKTLGIKVEIITSSIFQDNSALLHTLLEV
jgi:ADP-ribosylation factor-like protein 2